MRPELEAIGRRLGRSAGIGLDEAEGDVLGRRLGRAVAPTATGAGVSASASSGVRPGGPGCEATRAFGPRSSTSSRWRDPTAVRFGGPGLLEAAAAAGVLSVEQAELIARTRIDGEPLRALAQELGRPYDALRMERRRAEAALRTFALRYAGGAS